MGALCDLDQSNVIMVNIEELSEEDQRKYAELQEYIKKQFLYGVKKDCSGKVTIAQDFELSAIKLNKDKVEVIPTVSQSPPSDLVTQITTLSNKFDHAFNNQSTKFDSVFNDQNNLVASVITSLEKVEGKLVINDIHNDNIPQVDSQGVLHPTMSAAPGTSDESPVYGMPVGFYPGQTPLPKLTPVRPPPIAGLTA